MGSQSNLDIVLATTSRTTGSGAIILLVNVPRPLFRPALTSKKGSIFYKSLPEDVVEEIACNCFCQTLPNSGVCLFKRYNLVHKR